MRRPIALVLQLSGLVRLAGFRITAPFGLHFPSSVVTIGIYIFFGEIKGDLEIFFSSLIFGVKSAE